MAKYSNPEIAAAYERGVQAGILKGPTLEPSGYANLLSTLGQNIAGMAKSAQAATTAEVTAILDGISKIEASAQAQTAAENVRQRLLAQYQHSAKVWRQTGEDVAEGIMGGDAAEAEAKKKEQDDKEVNDALDKNAGGTAQSKTFTK